MVEFFRIPFATSGTRAAVPVAAQPDDSVSYDEGFPLPYQLDPDTEPTALNIPRDQFNQLMFAVTAAIQQYQTLGFPDFIEAADNGGVAYEYDINATVRYNDENYYSTVTANTSNPTDTTKWSPVVYAVNESPGICKMYWGSTLLSGYVWANGTTIGNAASGATGRANADTATLFSLLWESLPNSVLPIQTSAGAASSRGANAAADYAANKRLPTPDLRGRVGAGADDMGGAAAAGRLTFAASGITGTQLGASGGTETVALSANQNGLHSHSATTDSAGTHTHDLKMSPSDSGFGDAFGSDGVWTGAFPDKLPSESAGAHTHTIAVANSGLGSAHLNAQPTIVCNYIIKL